MTGALLLAALWLLCGLSALVVFGVAGIRAIREIRAEDRFEREFGDRAVSKTSPGIGPGTTEGSK